MEITCSIYSRICLEEYFKLVDDGCLQSPMYRDGCNHLFTWRSLQSPRQACSTHQFASIDQPQYVISHRFWQFDLNLSSALVTLRQPVKEPCIWSSKPFFGLMITQRMGPLHPKWEKNQSFIQPFEFNKFQGFLLHLMQFFLIDPQRLHNWKA